jgi:hypothetical protein
VALFAIAFMSSLSIATAQLRSGEPVSGVTLETYVKCRKDNEVLHHFIEEEAIDQTHAVRRHDFAVRYRWLRSPDAAETGKGHVCHIHPDRPVSYYCGFWKSEYNNYGYPFSDACHCSLDCFKRHWKLQLAYWEKAQNAKKQSLESVYRTSELITSVAFLFFVCQFQGKLAQAES